MLTIDPPPKECGIEGLYRVVYSIDVNAVNPKQAAKYVYRIMTDPNSLPPVLHIIDGDGKTVKIDLSEEKEGDKQ